MMAGNEGGAPAKSTTHMVIGFIGVIAVMMCGGVLYFVCTNASALTSANPPAGVQWALPVLISFASIPLTALVTMSTVRSREGDPSRFVTDPPDPAPTPVVMPQSVAAGPLPINAKNLVDPGAHGDHVPGSGESMSAGVVPPPTIPPGVTQ